MSNDNLRAAITAALKRRDPNADLDVSPTCTPLGAWVSLAGGVIRGPDGAVIDVVARASDDAKALRGVAFAVGLREDGSDPAEEVERLRADLDATRAAAREYLAAEASVLRVDAGEQCSIAEGDAMLDRLTAARDALRKIVEGE